MSVCVSESDIFAVKRRDAGTCLSVMINQMQLDSHNEQFKVQRKVNLLKG